MKFLFSTLVFLLFFILQATATYADDNQPQKEKSLQSFSKKIKHSIQEPRDEAHENRLDDQREQMRERHIDEHEDEDLVLQPKK